jgi:aconitate hydratase/homoaconitate hydratase
MCLGIASDKAGPGENWLTSQNRNFENRMGAGSIAWLASAPTVAASALQMRIADPRELIAEISEEEFQRLLAPAPSLPPVVVSEPEVAVEPAAAAEPGEEPADERAPLAGRAQLFGDHVDTDAIIPGEFCHLTDPGEIAKAAFHYVRPDFQERLTRGETILVAGEGWGSGSSREHAAWALEFAGVAAVVARSFAYIHKRNLVNEAIPFLVVTDDGFHGAVCDGDPLEVHPGRGVVVHAGREYPAEPASTIARRIQSEGGIVPAVQRHAAATFDVLTAAALASP